MIRSTTPSQSDWSTIEDLFHRALAQPADQRGDWLTLNCQQGQLRTMVARMIAAHVDSGTFLNVSPLACGAERSLISDHVIGQRFGAYRIVERLAEGGMGTVYRAVRDDGQFEKEVALKVIRRDLVTPETRRHFERERQLLARLEHPYIARMLDGGTTPDGVPYLVMEHVRGVPIDRYCAAARLGIRERLKLALKVCDAVAYAHRNLIVHRDLKPGNVLVNEDGAPRLLDFGLSKLLDRPPEETTVGHAWTPHYASPEQVRGEAVTTATDVYSLGVVLYEVLTGCRPYRVENASPLHAARVVCETDPIPPSAAISRIRKRSPGDGAVQTAAEVRDSGGAAEQAHILRRQMRGDLDSIVLKALEKDVARRYATVELLAQDIEHYLAGLPVAARGSQLGYRLGKLVRRHRWAVTAVAAVALSLASATIIATMSLMREATARRVADHEAARAQAVNDFLVSMLSSVDPSRSGRDARVADVLERACEQLASTPDLQPEVATSLHATIGVAYRALGMYDDAAPYLRTALDLSTQVYGPQHAQTLGVMNELAMLRWMSGATDEAKTLFRDALACASADDSTDDRFLLVLRNNLAGLQYEAGRLDEAEALFRRNWADQRILLGDEHEDTLRSMSNLGLVLRDQGRLHEAEELFRAVSDATQRLRTPGHPDTITAQVNLAAVLDSEGRCDEALPLMQAALDAQRKALGDKHPRTAAVLHNLGAMQLHAGRHDIAQSLLEEAHAIWREALGPTHADTLRTQDQLADVYRARGNLTEALQLSERTLELAKSALPDTHWQLGVFRTHYGEILAHAGRFADAERELEAASEFLRRQLGSDHPFALDAMEHLLQVYEASGQRDKAGYLRRQLNSQHTDAAPTP